MSSSRIWMGGAAAVLCGAVMGTQFAWTRLPSKLLTSRRQIDLESRSLRLCPN